MFYKKMFAKVSVPHKIQLYLLEFKNFYMFKKGIQIKRNSCIPEEAQSLKNQHSAAHGKLYKSFQN